MRRRWWYGAVALVLVAVGIVAWRAWPRDPGPVAPPLSARELRIASHETSSQVTLLPGGSRSEAHRLFETYEHNTLRNPDGTTAQHVRISLVHLSNSSTAWPTGDFWLVYAEHVYNPCLGICTGMSDQYGRAIDLYRPGTLAGAGSIDG
jgi:hypothetical protein